jgi:V/A-type H+-transporting ATPase subunit A
MFYERAGHVRTLAGDEGSVSLIGSVSPPGGDLAEPVTRHTQSVVRCFWVLSKPLADARHYPAIDWDLSFSDYADALAGWWDAGRVPGAGGWAGLRRRVLSLLREADEIKQVASVIGPAALSDRQQWTYYAANLVKEGFLQQNALDPVDTFCTAEKQAGLLTLMLDVYRQGQERLERGASCRALLRAPGLTRLKRARTEIPNDRLDLVARLRDDLGRELAEAAG